MALKLLNILVKSGLSMADVYQIKIMDYLSPPFGYPCSSYSYTWEYTFHIFSKPFGSIHVIFLKTNKPTPNPTLNVTHWDIFFSF